MDVNYTVREAAAQLLTPQEETSEQDQESMQERESPEKAQEQEVLEGSEEELDQEETSDETEEPDSEEDDDDGESEYEDDEDEDTDDSEEERYTVKVDGEEYEVDLPELIKGYQLEKSVTKKSQQVAEERKEVESLKSELESQRDYYAQVTAKLAQDSYKELEAAKEQLKAIDKEDDPIGFLTKQSEIAEIERGLNSKVQDYQRIQEEQQKAQQEYLAKKAAEHNKILEEKLEGWGDPKQSAELRKSIAEYAQAQGYTPEELGYIVDSRDIMVLNKARLYDEQQARRSTVTKKKAPAKPSRKIKASTKKSDSTKKARVVKDRRDRLGSTGKPKDAAALMMELMRQRSK